ncbi:CLIP-associated protein, partial [Zea mays]
MEAALEAARAKDTKERLARVERLHEALNAAACRGLTTTEGGLQALSAAAIVSGNHFKIHLNALVPAAVERLGDGKQPVHDAARQLLITLMEMLFKLVVITVLVIAESADTCIKTILQNCKVGRILPRIVDTTKNDRSAILRARCCEYALLILEYWADASGIQRSADLYEDMIKCYTVVNAMSFSSIGVIFSLSHI